METIHQSFEVRFSYPVHFTTDLFERRNPTLLKVIQADGDVGLHKILPVVDDGVLRHHPGLLAAIESYCLHHRLFNTSACDGHAIVVPGGERVKNTGTHVTALHSAVDELGVCRHSYVLAIGGGAVLDMAGYAAATAHRGVRLIRVPTTVLGQGDSAVGVKNGINYDGKKNFLGTFAPPWAVLNDFHFLPSLSDRDWRAGIAEAVKVGLIKDAHFFDFLEEHSGALAQRDLSIMKRVVYRCAQLHLSHIATSGDPFEFGSTRPLDFGHWAAHKLEQLTNYELRHGEAVAVGIALDSTYAYLAGMLAERDWRRVLDLIAALGLPLYAPELSRGVGDQDGSMSVLRGLDEFREHLGGQLTIMLITRIGVGVEVHEINEDLVVDSIDLLASYGGTRERSGRALSARRRTRAAAVRR